MFFSIAPQTVTLPDGTALSFAVDPVDSSLVSLVTPTHKLTFKRNGALLSSDPIPDPTPLPEPPLPYADSPSVDADAVRADGWKNPKPPKDQALKDYVANAGYPKDDGVAKSKGDTKPAA